MMRFTMLGLSTTLLFLVGCGSPLVGEWESDVELGNGDKNEMTIESDGSGDATIYATPANQPDNWVTFEFDVSWEEDGDEFDFEMDCNDGPCDGDDFQMECQIIDEGDGDVHKLECDVTKNARWESYPFDWQRAD